MKAVLAHTLALAALFSPFAARAQSDHAPTVIRGYFAALERKDFGRALELTTGSAETRTRHMVGDLERQAADHHADVQVHVRRLDVNPLADTVEVTFAIDIIGKKWMFSKVARRLEGTAHFSVGDDDRIVAIDGQLE